MHEFVHLEITRATTAATTMNWSHDQTIGPSSRRAIAEPS